MTTFLVKHQNFISGDFPKKTASPRTVKTTDTNQIKARHVFAEGASHFFFPSPFETSVRSFSPVTWNAVTPSVITLSPKSRSSLSPLSLLTTLRRPEWDYTHREADGRKERGKTKRWKLRVCMSSRRPIHRRNCSDKIHSSVRTVGIGLQDDEVRGDDNDKNCCRAKTMSLKDEPLKSNNSYDVIFKKQLC